MKKTEYSLQELIDRPADAVESACMLNRRGRYVEPITDSMSRAYENSKIEELNASILI